MRTRPPRTQAHRSARKATTGLTAVAAALAAAVAVALPQPAAAADSAPVGFGAGTTGGGSASAVTVSTLDAFKTAVSGGTAKVVKVNGLISLSGQVDVGSNTTVLGVGSSSGFTGGGLRLKKVSNVVLRNLNLSKPVSTDAITVQASTKVWIDHNSLSSDRSHGKDYYDGLVDVTHGSDYVTVSWNTFKDHYKGSLVGHSDSNAGEDTGHLRVTYHHNWFNNVNSRIPSLRFGTGHFYDNYVVGAETAVHSRMGAQMLVENNVFRSTTVAVTTSRDSDEDGYANLTGNDLGGAATEISRVGTFTKAPYGYTAEPASSVVASVTAGAGAGKI
ncbi:polysaccharide lyase family 1 protein [Streptomyces longwoodensis]|uniref:Polysaccharide lyase family 1 protein n=1 Tax=Streptomyces lasalocidi TaxID=324833 RepID=A0A4U5WF10_STRLS|nr:MULTISPECIES: polysaccharide lyase family 1 protein [Streptomyces]MCX4999725.1 polysaccharide lyase family 1 protein [Streptomyces longwoodensis]TKS99490.1 polysaccharide lyase family 1 protein [Streptomyces lasalocidi]WUC74739.1 polysaccharide lyase family 1 protein [Streptomyces longwoodensis]